MYTLLLRAALLVGVLGIVISCQAAVVTPEPEPEPLTLQGTWLWEGSYVDDEDGRTYDEVQVLTFTGSGRAVSFNAVYDDAGTQIDDWTYTSGWATNDTTVTRTWYDDHDDDDETPDVRSDLEKSYYWVEGRNAMFINPWGDEHPTDYVQRHTRVANPLPDGLAGTWTYDAEWDRMEDLGYIIGQHWTFAFGEDGAFTEVYRSTRSDNNEVGYFTVMGTWSHDNEDPNFVLVSVDTATYLRPDGALVDLAEIAPYWIGATLRYAYAPTDSPDLITVSTRVSELRYDEETGMWVDNMYNPYGDYWMRLSRQQ